MRKWTLPWKNWQKSSEWAFSVLLMVGFLGLPLLANGQFVQKYPIAPHKNPVAFKSNKVITAVAMVTEAAINPTRMVVINGTKYELELDIHAPKPTYFLSLPVPATSISIPETREKIDLYTIHSGTPPSLAQESKSETHCTEVVAIPQSEWRAGLPAPEASPAFHTVTHHIVHHTAGSNSNTNYTQVVRDIYLLHTAVNGWDDIGYNFVIAQDGTLYEGRDPGGNRSEFEVRGAHFCAKNTGTFGVALLGNYETAQLTDETRERLVSLLSYSLSELSIHPLSTAEHRGEELDAISGHRDGCATLCPGRNVYQLLPEIREDVLVSLQECAESLVLSYALDQNTINTGESITFENTSVGYDSYRWKFAGGTPEESEAATPVVTYRQNGLHTVTLYGQLGNQEDSLVMINAVQVVGPNPAPKTFPNPLNIGELFEIEYFDEIGNIYLYALSGTLVAQYPPELNVRYQAPSQPGFYTIMIETASETFAQKLVVR